MAFRSMIRISRTCCDGKRIQSRFIGVGADKLQVFGKMSRLYSSSFSFGPRPPHVDDRAAAAEDIEEQMFGNIFSKDAHGDSFFQELDKLEKAHGKAKGGDDWSIMGEGGENLDGLTEDGMGEGIDKRLRRAALDQDYDAPRPHFDYTYRPDTFFPPGSTYSMQDLDVRKPTTPRPNRRAEMRATSREVLRKADFRNVGFLQHFISEAGLIYSHKKFGITPKAQRKIAREIKTARCFGLMPFTCMGTKPFAFGRNMEDHGDDYHFDQFKGDEVIEDDDDDIEVDDGPEIEFVDMKN